MYKIIRGTTPQLTFDVQTDTSLFEELYITFAQNRQVKLQKTLEDCTLSSRKITTNLSQEDTLKFSEDYPLEIQLRIKYASDMGVVANCEPIIVEVCKVFKGGII